MLEIDTQREYENLVEEWALEALKEWKENNEEEDGDAYDVVDYLLEGDGIIYTYDALRILTHSKNEDAWTELGGNEVLPEGTSSIFCYMATWAIRQDMIEYLENR